MAEQSITSTVLPVLSLPGAVAFPGTVVTITLESDDALVAATAAADHGGQLLLLADVEGRTNSVGV